MVVSYGFRRSGFSFVEYNFEKNFTGIFFFYILRYLGLIEG
uniref:Uncharacterized protein n=1 Tax=Arundo donax TaxID=35708 RepID=A0A0A9DG37_ARUDO